MKVLQIIPTLSPEHGGPSESVWRLTVGLRALGVSAGIWATDEDTSVNFMDRCAQKVSDLRFFESRKSVLGSFSWRFAGDLQQRVKDYDLVHIHSVFNYITLAASTICSKRGVPYVISPRGMFQPWSLRRRALAKAALRRLCVDRQFRAAHGLHVTSEYERESLAALFPETPIAVIPNPLPHIRSSSVPFFEQFPEFKGKRLLLYLSRIHPKKGVHELLEAWRRVSDEFPDWHLVLVGPGQHQYVRNLQTSITRLHLHQRVSWLGPLFDEDRDEAYKAAELFVQPSYQENFGNSIAEALAVGCPVITTQETPWRILQERGWGWWIPMNVEALTQALRRGLSLPSAELKRMGADARTWVSAECSVESVGRRMLEWYRWVLKLPAPPKPQPEPLPRAEQASAEAPEPPAQQELFPGN